MLAADITLIARQRRVRPVVRIGLPVNIGWFHTHSRIKTTGREEETDAPSGIRTLVLAVRGQDDWPDYTNGAYPELRGYT